MCLVEIRPLRTPTRFVLVTGYSIFVKSQGLPEEKDFFSVDKIRDTHAAAQLFAERAVSSRHSSVSIPVVLNRETFCALHSNVGRVC